MDKIEGAVSSKTAVGEDEPVPVKTLASLVSNLHDDHIEDSEINKVFAAVGLAGREKENINLTLFRKVICENLNVDPSFMYKRVFNAFSSDAAGHLTPRQLVTCLSTLLQGTFKAHVGLALRVYDKSGRGHQITRPDAVTCILESLQLSSPRSRNTLSTSSQKACSLAEDLISIIFPKFDLNGDGVITSDEFSQACLEDPTLLQCFGQFLPLDCAISLPTPEDTKEGDSDNLQRIKSTTSVKSFDGVNYLTHSPTMSTMWGRSDRDTNAKSDRLEPIQLVEPEK